jgi:hypothetical protein
MRRNVALNKFVRSESELCAYILYTIVSIITYAELAPTTRVLSLQHSCHGARRTSREHRSLGSGTSGPPFSLKAPILLDVVLADVSR